MSGSGNGRGPAPPPIVGESAAIRRAAELIERYATSKAPVLLVGATGTGKDLLAQHLHWRSARPGRLVAVNCAALPREMADSLLFGHRRGAFTGAMESRPGYFRVADGSTLFLDELLSLPVECQAKLLRAVEAGEVWPLDENEPVAVNVRIVAAVQEDVWTRLESGALRRDLFRRLAAVTIELPPLVDRPEDIGPLARCFAGAHGCTLTSEAEAILRGAAWPDNVRQLRQVIERAVILANAGALDAGAVQTSVAMEPLLRGIHPCETLPVPQPPSLRDPAAILRIGRARGWDATKMADAFGISRAWLFRTLKDHGLSLRMLRRADKSTQSRSSTVTVDGVDAVDFRADGMPA